MTAMKAEVVLGLAGLAEHAFGSEGTFLSYPLSLTGLSADRLTALTRAPSTPEGARALAEFSLLVNQVADGPVWQPRGELLWNVYDDVLRKSILADVAADPALAAQAEEAWDLLYVGGADGPLTPSDTLITYRQHADAYHAAEQEYRNRAAQAAITSDQIARDAWAHDEPGLRARRDDALALWQKDGLRSRVDHARQVIDGMATDSPEAAWNGFQRLFNPELDLHASLEGIAYAPTSYVPTDVLGARWSSVDLGPDELAVLTRSAPPALRNRLPSGSGCSGVERVSLEYTSIGVERAWFSPGAFASRAWRFEDGSRVLSDGGTPPRGECPGYVSAVVLARNIVITGGPDEHAADLLFLPASAGVQPPAVLDQLELDRNVGVSTTPSASREIVIPAVPSLRASGSAAPSSSKAEYVYVLAFICRPLPESPNPDPILTWAHLPRAPVLALANPGRGAAGKQVLLTGEGIGSATSVRFGDASAQPVTAHGERQLLVVAPNGAHHGGEHVHIAVTTPAGVTKEDVEFTYLPPPSLSSVSPPRGGSGVEVRIVGRALSGATAVHFGDDDAASFLAESDSCLIAVASVLSKPGPTRVSVETEGGTSLDDVRYEYVPTPHLTRLSPAHGRRGTAVDLTGEDLSAVASVTFDGVESPSFEIRSPKSIRAVVPALVSVGPVQVSVATADGVAAIDTTPFTYESDSIAAQALTWIRAHRRVTLGVVAAIIIAAAAAVIALALIPPSGRVTVPNVQGLSEQQARAAIASAALDLGTIDRRFDANVADGTVLAQIPPARASVKRHSLVSLAVAANIVVPSLLGVDEADAMNALAKIGLRPTAIRQDSMEQYGSVIASSPGAGARVRDGSTVIVTIAALDLNVLRGLTLIEARSALKHRGLVAQAYYDDRAGAGRIVNEDAGTCARLVPLIVVFCRVSDVSGPVGITVRLAVRP